MNNIHFNPKQTYLYMQTYIFVACCTDLLVPIDIFCPHISVFFYCHSLHGLTCSNRRFLSSAVAYVDQTIHTDVLLSLFLPHSPHTHRHTHTCPHTQTFVFLCRGLHRPTRPLGHFLFINITHTDLLAQTDAF